MTHVTDFASLKDVAVHAPQSGIVEIANYGRAKQGTLPLWVGEGDMATPAFITEAATRSLAAGETFYTWQRGIPELREALADYNSALYGRELSPDRFFVTGSGMHAIQIAMTMVAGEGDEVIVLSPAWPNAPAAVGLRGAKPIMVPLFYGENGWHLDMEQLAAAITPRTKAMFINSPSNPTGWTATQDDLAALLAVAHAHDLWIIADEIYNRFYWRDETLRAPSFHDVRGDDDKIIFVNTFSKNWAMTGWRLGWLEAPPALGQVVENLIQYSNSGVPTFVQRAGIAALKRGSGFLDHQVDKARKGRAAICDALEKSAAFDVKRPDGAFYLFFALKNLADSRKAAFSLIDECGVGVAPGSAFGVAGEGFMRLCFLRSVESLHEAGERLTRRF